MLLLPSPFSGPSQSLDPGTKDQLERLARGDLSAVTDALGDAVGDADMQELRDVLNDPAKLNKMTEELLGGNNPELAKNLQVLLWGAECHLERKSKTVAWAFLPHFWCLPCRDSPCCAQGLLGKDGAAGGQRRSSEL